MREVAGLGELTTSFMIYPWIVYVLPLWALKHFARVYERDP